MDCGKIGHVATDFPAKTNPQTTESVQLMPTSQDERTHTTERNHEVNDALGFTPSMHAKKSQLRQRKKNNQGPILPPSKNKFDILHVLDDENPNSGGVTHQQEHGAHGDVEEPMLTSQASQHKSGAD